MEPNTTKPRCGPPEHNPGCVPVLREPSLAARLCMCACVRACVCVCRFGLQPKPAWNPADIEKY